MTKDRTRLCIQRGILCVSDDMEQRRTEASPVTTRSTTIVAFEQQADSGGTALLHAAERVPVVRAVPRDLPVLGPLVDKQVKRRRVRCYHQAGGHGLEEWAFGISSACAASPSLIRHSTARFNNAPCTLS